MNLKTAIENRTARVGVIGLGYVGLPLVRALAEAGYPVVGFDIDSTKIQTLRQGQSYISHIPAEWIARLVESGRFQPTDDFSLLRRVQAILICVPTPLTANREPDLSFVTGTAQTISQHLQPNQLVVLESTTYPGTTEEVVRPILESSGLKAGQEFYLAYSPEREDPGNPHYTAAVIPKVVGGTDLTSRDLAATLYRQVVADVVPVSSTQVAEATKILENTYRAVNIALVNELKVLLSRMGIDVWEVIDAAKTKPFGFQAFYPGPGLGGHCIPIDPFYLSWLARRHDLSTRFIELAGEVNAAMPDYVVSRTIEALNRHSKPLRDSQVAVLGVAYKKDVDDPRGSPSFVIMEKLMAQGARVSYNDPYIPKLPRMRHHALQMESQSLEAEYLSAQDCVILVTDHSSYDIPWIVKHSRLLVDTRGATRNLTINREHVVSA